VTGSRSCFTACAPAARIRATVADPFGAPTPIVEVNTPGLDDGDPTVSANQRVLVFHRLLDLFQSTR
jgi:hypothetical protein